MSEKTATIGSHGNAPLETELGVGETDERARETAFLDDETDLPTAETAFVDDETDSPFTETDEGLSTQRLKQIYSIEIKPLRIPLAVLLREAADLAELMDRNFKARKVKGLARPGLSNLVGAASGLRQMPHSLRELAREIDRLHSEYKATDLRPAENPLPAARRYLFDIRAALEFVLFDIEDGETVLSRLSQYETRTPWGLAYALESYAELAFVHREKLSALGIEESFIDEGIAFAQKIRLYKSQLRHCEKHIHRRDTYELRNRYITALTQEMVEARRAIRYVFRDDPYMLAQASSSYQRKRNKKHRVATKEKGLRKRPLSGLQG